MPVVKRYTFSPGVKLPSSQLNTDFDDIYNAFNTHTHSNQGNDAAQITSSGIAAGGSVGAPQLGNAGALFSATAAAVGSNTTPSMALFQVGSNVVSTNGAGGGSVTFTTAFPTGVWTVVAQIGDNNIGAGGSTINIIQAQVSLTGFGFQTNQLSQTIRVNWIALGF